MLFSFSLITAVCILQPLYLAKTWDWHLWNLKRKHCGREKWIVFFLCVITLLSSSLSHRIYATEEKLRWIIKSKAKIHKRMCHLNLFLTWCYDVSGNGKQTKGRYLHQPSCSTKTRHNAHGKRMIAFLVFKIE